MKKKTPPQEIIHYLSIRQPYSWAILKGKKKVEYRTWPTSIRGRIYIHAGKSLEEMDPQGGAFAALRKLGMKRIPKVEDLVFGAIVGSVEIVDCVELKDGRYKFVLQKPRLLAEPVPMKANAKMQRVPANILRKIKLQG